MKARWLATTAALLAALGAAVPAHAGLFDDEEARRQIGDLKATTAERLDKLEAATRGQLELSNQIEALRADLARMVGQVEVLTYELDAAQKRQKDFYIDLDTRLRKLEGPAAPGAATPPAGEEPRPGSGTPAAAAAPKSDPAAEAKEYEGALNYFKAGKYKEAANSLDGFVKNHPDSSLAPSAQYWLGNSHFALRDCKKAIDAQNVVVAKWPDSPKAPDALLNIATCQQELGDAKAAKKALETLVAKYPAAPAAESARQRLKKK
ncbi:MAG TPA: tol-pal system protein YbgF [Azospira sp.]|nr:tol-pal system protein YbgF [Azospira sp.]